MAIPVNTIEYRTTMRQLMDDQFRYEQDMYEAYIDALVDEEYEDYVQDGLDDDEL